MWVSYFMNLVSALTYGQLLLQSSGGETPLIHAIRIGNKDVAIVLLGAFSRWVNYLEDKDLRNAQTQTYLKALRGLSVSP